MDQRQRVIFLSGHLCTASLWYEQMHALNDEASCKVLALYGSDNVAGLAKHVLDHAPERFSLAGLSLGGYVSMEIMRQAPHRVERLALLDTIAAPDRPDLLERRQADMQMSTDHGMKLLCEQLATRWLAPEHANDPRMREILLDMAQEVGVAHQREQQKAIISRPDSRRSIQAIGCPTLVLCGRQDSVTPVSVHEEMAALIPGAQLQIVEHCGHLSPLEQPKAVSQALRSWLTWY
jgi:pimeloyl-ACP methyl ester carboxylesterase